MNINKDKLLANIKDVKNIANVKMLACTKNLFSKIGILNNIGFFITISIVLFRIMDRIVCYTCITNGYDSLKDPIVK